MFALLLLWWRDTELSTNRSCGGGGLSKYTMMGYRAWGNRTIFLQQRYGVAILHGTINDRTVRFFGSMSLPPALLLCFPPPLQRSVYLNTCVPAHFIPSGDHMEAFRWCCLATIAVHFYFVCHSPDAGRTDRWLNVIMMTQLGQQPDGFLLLFCCCCCFFALVFAVVFVFVFAPPGPVVSCLVSSRRILSCPVLPSLLCCFVSWSRIHEIDCNDDHQSPRRGSIANRHHGSERNGMGGSDRNGTDSTERQCIF